MASSPGQMSGKGYGIAGAKNSYSSGVRVGKWVEDTIGAELAKKPPMFSVEYKSEARASYSREAADMRAAMRDAVPPPEGVPFHVLMGQRPGDKDERFVDDKHRRKELVKAKTSEAKVRSARARMRGMRARR